MNSKIMAHQARSWLTGLSDSDLLALLQMHSPQQPLHRLCKEISYKCFECSIVFNGRRTNGYGRNEKEAQTNCLKNILDYALEEESFLVTIRSFLKRGESRHDPLNNTIQPKFTQLKPSSDTKFEPKNLQNRVAIQLKGKEKHTTPTASTSTSKYNSACPSVFVNCQAEDETKAELLVQANKRISNLERRVRELETQNHVLKSQVTMLRAKENKPPVAVYDSAKLNQYVSVQPVKQTVQTALQEQSRLMNRSQERRQTRSVSQAGGDKKKVPLLNLAVLPNYHGKSNKSINSQLLSLWEKNHGGLMAGQIND